MVVTLAVVGDEALVVLDIRVELLHRFQELPGRAIITIGHRRVQVHLDGLYDPQRLINISMSEAPLEPFQRPSHVIA